MHLLQLDINPLWLLQNSRRPQLQDIPHVATSELTYHNTEDAQHVLHAYCDALVNEGTMLDIYNVCGSSDFPFATNNRYRSFLNKPPFNSHLSFLSLPLP
jgi:hypothetical protein